MKTRNGFVSNSSSSSFVVQRWSDFFGNPKKMLSADVERELEKMGFTLQFAHYPSQVEGRPESEDPNLQDEFTDKMKNWCRYVICNQEDNIFFLLKERISFMADIHYGNSSMIYDGKTDKLLIAQNFGSQAQMAGEEKVDFVPWKDTPGIQKTTGEKYLKKHK
jgi:hypothetical protein